MKRLLALCMGAFLLTSCGGGGGSHLVPAPSATAKSPGAAKVQVSIRVIVPSAAKARKALTAKRAHTLQVASAADTAEVTVYASTDTVFAHPLATAISNVAAGGPNCGGLDSNDDRTCTIAIGAPTGSDVFLFQAFDTPSAGTIPAGTQPLDTAVKAQTITAGVTASVGVTLTGVVSQVALTLEPDTVHYLVSTNGTAIVVAQDADGNVIAGNYYDLNDNSLNVTVTSPLDPNNDAYLAFNETSTSCCNSATATLSAAPATGVPFTFAQNSYLNTYTCTPVCFGDTSFSNLTANASANVTATASTSVGGPVSGSVTPGSATLSIIYPTFTTIADPNLTVAGNFGGGATFASGSLYYNVQGTNAGIDMATDPVGGGTSSQLATDPIIGGLAVTPGAFGDIYVVGLGGQLYALEYLQPTPAFFDECAASCPIPNGSSLALDTGGGPDVYYLSGQNFVDFNTDSETFTTTSIPSISNAGMAVDPITFDGWATNNVVGGAVYNIVSGGAVTPVSLNNPNAEPGDIVADPNSEAMWVADRANGHLYQINAASNSVENTIAINFNGVPVPPWHTVFDPINTHILWFDTIYNNQLAIGRLDTTTGYVNIAPYNGASLPTINGTQQPGAMAVDPTTDNIYIVYDGGGNVVEVQP